MSTVDIKPTWRATMQILINVLEDGTPAGKQMARDELIEIGERLDDMLPGNAPDLTEIDYGTSKTWEQWSRAVIDQLIDDLQIDNGDAQAIFESMPVMTMQIWHADYTPAQAARAIDHASRVTT